MPPATEPTNVTTSPWRGLRRLLYSLSLGGIPLGLAGALLGLYADSYPLAAGGLATAAISVFLWTDDQHPDHPGGA
jgi:hypothetical protein